MLHYSLIAKRPYQHSLDVEITFTAVEAETIVQIPYWRPGRYEAGNFPKNYINFIAYSHSGEVHSEKITDHQWNLTTAPGTEIKLYYTCYASELSAGNTYFDDQLLLINPVNCVPYIIGLEHEECRFSLLLPPGWHVRSAMKPDPDATGYVGMHIFRSSDMQELMDTPILAAPEIETLHYKVNEIPFYIDIYGDGVDDREKLCRQFESFTKKQIEAFGTFPVDRYRFLLLFMPQKIYHGVEHETSTVILLGPDSDIDKPEIYKELLGISSHELYHTWNVKNLRPNQWTPYDFTGPAFSRLGYIAEGVTTYMGDFMLWQTGEFEDSQFLSELSTHFQRHMDNGGRKHTTLAEASIDTWVDGYGRGTPRRRVSIYVEGALLALICDIQLLVFTNGNKGLNDVMKSMYEKYGEKKGYSEQEYWKEIKQISGDDDHHAHFWDQLAADVLDTKNKLTAYLSDALKNMGLAIIESTPANLWEDAFGFSVVDVNGLWTVYHVDDDSPAEQSGLWFGDIIVSVNGDAAQTFFESEHKKSEQAIDIEITSGFRTRSFRIIANRKSWTRRYHIALAGKEKSSLFASWKNLLKAEIIQSA